VRTPTDPRQLWSADWWTDRAVLLELWRERALERAHAVGGAVERARRAGAIYRAAVLFACWRRCIAIANHHRELAQIARCHAAMFATRGAA